MLAEKEKLNALISAKIRFLRKALKLKQEEFAAKIGVDQTTVSKWEKVKARPTPDALVRIAALADEVDKLFFLEHAGLPPQFLDGNPMIPEVETASVHVIARAFGEVPSAPKLVWVPLYKDSVAAGEPRGVHPEIDEFIPFAEKLMPKGSKLVALKVCGDSMAPIICDGYVVILDIAQRDPRQLIGRMVAAREGDGITVKWLRRDRNEYLLVPQHVSPRIPVRIMREEDGWGIVGVVIKWIGYPPSGK